MQAGYLPYAFHLVLCLLLAPGIRGSLRSVSARIQGHRGAHPAQAYVMLWKLWQKDTLLPESASMIYSLVPPLVFAIYLLLALMLPIPVLLAGQSPAPPFNMILLIYLLALAGFLEALVAFEIGTPFALRGQARFSWLRAMAEPIVFLTFFILILLEHTTKAPNLFRFESAPLSITSLLATGFGLLALAVCSCKPFEDNHTLFELTMLRQAVNLEYRGRHLALLEWTESIKLLLLLSLTAGLCCGGSFNSPFEAWLQHSVYLTILILCLPFWEALWVKLRLKRMADLTIIALLIVMVALIYMATTIFIFGGGYG